MSRALLVLLVALAGCEPQHPWCSVQPLEDAPMSHWDLETAIVECDEYADRHLEGIDVPWEPGCRVDSCLDGYTEVSAYGPWEGVDWYFDPSGDLVGVGGWSDSGTTCRDGREISAPTYGTIPEACR